MPIAIFLYKNSHIAYRRFGTGKKVLLCLHGYGESSASFNFLENNIPPEIVVIAPDLPFHGATQWKEGLNIGAQDLETIVSGILMSEGFPALTDSIPIRLIGYSLGGRIGLSVYQQHPAAIEKMILLAPDGIKVNFWYWLASQTWLGNKLFFFTMRYPQWFFFFLKLFRRVGMLNISIYRFIQHYLENPALRTDLYNRWTSLRRLRPQIPLIKRQIRQRHTAVQLIYGQYDRVIVPQSGRHFQRGLSPFVQLEVVASGHNLLKEKYLPIILKALND